MLRTSEQLLPPDVRPDGKGRFLGEAGGDRCPAIVVEYEMTGWQMKRRWGNRYDFIPHSGEAAPTGDAPIGHENPIFTGGIEDCGGFSASSHAHRQRPTVAPRVKVSWLLSTKTEG